MASIKVREMEPSDEYFVFTCSHVNETDEIDVMSERRGVWLKENYSLGLRVKVGLLDDEPVGFAYLIPIDICPWGPLGKDLMVLPCLWVIRSEQNKGVGHALMEAAEKEARGQERKALVVTGFYNDFWFMPAAFFEKHGFSVVHRKDDIAILWKVFDESAEQPKFLERNYKFKAIPDKVVVDLFWQSFCGTSNGEAQRVREVVDEFDDSVVLNEYCADDRDVLLGYQIPRGIFVNGSQIDWGFAAPKDGIREAISKALNL